MLCDWLSQRSKVGHRQRFGGFISRPVKVEVCHKYSNLKKSSTSYRILKFTHFPHDNIQHEVSQIHIPNLSLHRFPKYKSQSKSQKRKHVQVDNKVKPQICQTKFHQLKCSRILKALLKVSDLSLWLGCLYGVCMVVDRDRCMFG